MSLEIHPFNLGEAVAPADFLVMLHPGEPIWIPCNGFLITGGESPVLVDTGFRDTDSLARAGFESRRPSELTIESHLAGHGLKINDIRYLAARGRRGYS